MKNSAQLKKLKLTDTETPNSMSVVVMINRAIKKIVNDENMIMTFKTAPCDKIFYERNDTSRTIRGTYTNSYQFKPIDYVRINYGQDDAYILKSESDKITDCVCTIWLDGAMYPHRRGDRTKVEVFVRKPESNVDTISSCDPDDYEKITIQQVSREYFGIYLGSVNRTSAFDFVRALVANNNGDDSRVDPFTQHHSTVQKVRCCI